MYNLPNAGAILTPCPVAGNVACEIDGAEIAAFLTGGGLACTCVSSVAAPQLDYYLFTVQNLYKIGVLARLQKPLETFVHRSIKIIYRPSGAHFGLEISRRVRGAVYLRECCNCNSWALASNNAPGVLGVNTQNSPVWIDLYSAPHLLIAGETGAGKSVLVNSIICSVLLKNSPETARFVMIDPKQVEFAAYKNLPHLLQPIITSPRAAVAALESLCDTMEERYTRAAARGLKYSPETPIICIIDELADLMITSRAAVEKYIVRIAQKGRAARIHLIIATQSPRASVITGLIKANMPTKIALTCSNIRESMVILDHGGAEKLTGRGDCILKTPLTPDEIRIQAAYTPEKDIENIIAYWKNQAAPRRRWPFWK